MKHQKANLVLLKATDFIESKTCSAARQSSKDTLAAHLPRLCTICSLEIFGELVQIEEWEFADFLSGNLSTISLCHSYRTLQWVLCHSKWQSISAAFPSLKDVRGSRHPSSIDEWISKPFPGLWSCKRGFLLWRPPFHSTAGQTDVRSLCVSSITDDVLISFTRVYWHALCRPPLPSRQCEGRILPKALQRQMECRNCHDAALRLSDLKRHHASLLRLLINKARVTGKSNPNLILRDFETLQSTKGPCKNLKIKYFAIHGSITSKEMTEYRGSENLVRDMPDKLKQESKNTLHSAIHIPPSTSSGVASDESSNSFPWAMVPSTIRAMLLRVLRVVGLCETLVERGKCRVRWTCVSNPSETKKLS